MWRADDTSRVWLMSRAFVPILALFLFQAQFLVLDGDHAGACGRPGA